MELLRFYRRTAFDSSYAKQILAAASSRLGRNLGRRLETETCFYVGLKGPITGGRIANLHWLLRQTFDRDGFGERSFLGRGTFNLEVGPRLNFVSAFSSNATSICRRCDLHEVYRLERSIRFGLEVELSETESDAFLGPLHDRMTQQRYLAPLTTFEQAFTVEPTYYVQLIEQGMPALEALNQRLGLAFDDQDLELWYGLFVNVLKRNPTNVELFQIAQANSEHCRHWFWKGLHVIDGVAMTESLMDIVRSTMRPGRESSLVSFHDNSATSRGYKTCIWTPTNVVGPGPYQFVELLLHHIVSAESHNHPSMIEPFEGAATGVGGELRDRMGAGRGSVPILSFAGYCTGNLQIPGSQMPWEVGSLPHPATAASPLEIAIRASDGASNYGNCYGEPVTLGFFRTFGETVSGEHRAWFKPVVYVGGIGTIQAEHVEKGAPEPGMAIVLLGGPGYRIGVGGGAASSMHAGQNTAALDFASVQRGDPEMGSRTRGVIRACVNLGSRNPIVAVHDLGAGGTCNAIPEIAEPLGALVDLAKIPIGDPSLTDLEAWGNEAQERMVVCVTEGGLQILIAICEREGCPFAVVGTITAGGQFVLEGEDGTPIVDLPLERILGNLPAKRFEHTTILQGHEPFVLPAGTTVRQALDLVLRLPSVASKQWLAKKVDRSVGGLAAQQSCVGPFHLPLSGYTVRANGFLGKTGQAASIGEQPIVGLVNAEAMARLALAEALLNMAGVYVEDGSTEAINCSANWMWPAKKPGEGARLYLAARALRDAMLGCGVAISRGKDSLTMAATTEGPSGPTVVKAPGQLVLTAEAAVPDVSRKVTPDLKSAGNLLYLVELPGGQQRLGGSALAQVFGQVGNETPDVESPADLRTLFETLQRLVGCGFVASLQDRSDGGTIVALLEMAFTGGFGLDLSFSGAEGNPFPALFNQEPGVIIEVEPGCLSAAEALLKTAGLPYTFLGTVADRGENVTVCYNGGTLIDEPMVSLRAVWSETSYQLERLQQNPAAAEEERNVTRNLVVPPFVNLAFDPSSPVRTFCGQLPKVAVIREEGTNGELEMAAALGAAGFEVWDVAMRDLEAGLVTLDQFRGIVFAGGFSFADALDSAKGWAGVILFNGRLAEQFDRFFKNQSKFSLGVCNGCQLMALLGVVPGLNLTEERQPRFIHNRSGRFESRFTYVRILTSPSLMLRGMEGSVLGTWVAHGEGRLHLPDDDGSLMQRIGMQELAPLRYVDPSGSQTEAYPFNPNGSPGGVAALCSPCGRHLAMMPHPERSYQLRQLPYVPDGWSPDMTGPWLRMFQNAYHWCLAH